MNSLWSYFGHSFWRDQVWQQQLTQPTFNLCECHDCGSQSRHAESDITEKMQDTWISPQSCTGESARLICIKETPEQNSWPKLRHRGIMSLLPLESADQSERLKNHWFVLLLLSAGKQLKDSKSCCSVGWLPESTRFIFLHLWGKLSFKTWR